MDNSLVPFNLVPDGQMFLAVFASSGPKEILKSASQTTMRIRTYITFLDRHHPPTLTDSGTVDGMSRYDPPIKSALAQTKIGPPD